MLMKLYYLYQKSPKRYRKLKELSVAYEKYITKPTKAHGTRWIDHKYRAMERVLDNDGPYIAHLESPCHTDSQALKRAELVGQAKKWKDATYPMYMAIYLDILSPICSISVAMQSDFHDPVKVVKRIKEFRWTMAKLVLDEALDKEGSALTHFTKLMKEIKVKENGKHEYQGVQLKYYNRSFQSVKDHYLINVLNICECVEQRFDSPIFQSVESVLDIFTWPIDGNCGQFGNKGIDRLVNHYKDLLNLNGCEVSKVSEEWLTLKAHVIPIVKNHKKVKYHQIWKKVFENSDLKKEYENVLHVIKVLLIIPFTNAKVERLFSRINRVKAIKRNRLGRDHLDLHLRVGEEGPDIEEFDPDIKIDLWFSEKVRQLTAGPHQPKRKRENDRQGTGACVDINSLVMSDVEED